VPQCKAQLNGFSYVNVLNGSFFFKKKRTEGSSNNDNSGFLRTAFTIHARRICPLFMSDERKVEQAGSRCTSFTSVLNSISSSDDR